MNDEPLPKQADLRKLAAKQAHFDVHIHVSQLPRFSGVVVDKQGEITADLHFGIDEQKIRYIKGTVSCNTQVVCQRCLKPVDIQVHSDVELGIVWDEVQAKQLPKAMDPIIVADGELVDLNEVIVEELLLSMPFVSYHDYDCGIQQDSAVFSDFEEVIEEKENPFSVLEQLKSSKE